MIGLIVGLTCAMAFVALVIATATYGRVTNLEAYVRALEPAANDEDFGEFDPEEFPLL